MIVGPWTQPHSLCPLPPLNKISLTIFPEQMLPHPSPIPASLPGPEFRRIKSAYDTLRGEAPSPGPGPAPRCGPLLRSPECGMSHGTSFRQTPLPKWKGGCLCGGRPPPGARGALLFRPSIWTAHSLLNSVSGQLQRSQSLKI